MWKGTSSIRFQLFLSYAAIILVISVLFVSAFYLYKSRELTSQTFQSSDELSLSLSTKLDLEIQKIDNVTLSVAYSNLIKDKLLKLAPREAGNAMDEDLDERLFNVKELIEVMVAAIGPAQSVRELTIYDYNENRISSGALTQFAHERVQDKPWYEAVTARHGSSLIELPERDAELEQSFIAFKGRYFISLFRMYFDSVGTAQGIVQAEQDADVVFSSLIDLEQNKNISRQFYVLDKKGRQLYPYGDVRQAGSSLKRFIDDNVKGQTLFVHNDDSGRQELISYHTSDESGWTVITVMPKDELFGSLKDFAKMLGMATAAILVLALPFSYYAARRVTRPIARLHSAIRKMELNRPAPVMRDMKSGFNELEALNLAFQDMNANVQLSLDKLLYAQSQEIRATIAALSSQMNPHFLYNTITTISIMAEEGMSPEIVRLCQKLSHMLRYIASDGSDTVDMRAEADYTRTYLECMQIRYMDDLQFHIEIDEALMPLRIPKLVIQPLVENAIKHGIHIEPPWHLRITGYRSGKQWMVAVEDNGPGISEDKRRAIMARIEQLNKANKFPSLKLDGMGLLNIYFRLKLVYGTGTIFEIQRPKQGFCIVIGGRMEE